MSSFGRVATACSSIARPATTSSASSPGPAIHRLRRSRSPTRIGSSAWKVLSKTSKARSFATRAARSAGSVPAAASTAASRPDPSVRQYLEILKKALAEGDDRADRTGVGTRAIFGEAMRFDLAAGFPAVTTKRLAFRSVVAELLWFLAGSSDVNELHALGVHIWDGNAFADYWVGRARFPVDTGRNYGQQWRDWIAPDGRHVDQLREVIQNLSEKPESRRHVVTALNPGELDQTSLPACHPLFQLFVAPRDVEL